MLYRYRVSHRRAPLMRIEDLSATAMRDVSMFSTFPHRTDFFIFFVAGGRFIVKNKSFTQQFSHVYNKRLLGLKGAVREAAEKRWGRGKVDGVKIVDRLVNMKEGEEWVVIGTTYKARILLEIYRGGGGWGGLF